MSVHLAGPVAYLEQSGSAVFFTKSAASAGTFGSNRGTASPIKNLQNALNVAFWGEDNRFPQNIEQQMAYCGVGKSALDKRMRELWGGGLIVGKVIDIVDGGKTEIFEPLKGTKYDKTVFPFLKNRKRFRFWLEYIQDWVWYHNCFPEMVLSLDGKTITDMVHQESCDSRYQQMNDNAEISKVFLSKMWGAAANQYARFDPAKKILGLLENPTNLANMEIDAKYLKSLDCIDMYDPVESLKAIAEKQVNSKGKPAFKSAILPTNYPSVNKTYYQVPYWDGARLGGWVEISCKIPALLKVLYSKAFRIKYHIKIAESYFERKYTFEKWHGMAEKEQEAARKKLLKEMDTFLTSDENAFRSFVSFYDVDQQTRKEYGQVFIEVIEDKNNIDKELITSSAADTQIAAAIQIHPNQMGIGNIGNGQQRSGGSDIREAKLTTTSSLHLERNVMLEPLYLVRDYNREVGEMDEWEEDIEFRIVDTVLTQLSTGGGTERVVS